MNDRDLERVLKSAGLREKPPADVERDVREHLRGQWRDVVADRNRRSRQRTVFALAAGVLAAVFGLWALVPRLAESPATVGSVAVVAGDVRVTSGLFDRWHAVTAGQALVEGQALETGSNGRSALSLPGGISARIDRGSRLIVASADRLELERGTIYVDSGTAPLPAAPLDVVTASGTVRHVGTQYEVRLLQAGVQVSVRDGTIEWRSRRGDVERSRSGERLTISEDGRVERTNVPGYGAAWDWAMEAAPAIEIEGMPLSQFLAWAARETGREVTYASPAIQSEAAGIVLHGSIAGLTPPEALDAVLATTSVRSQVSGGSLVVDGR
ncbi:MAG TPA: FecR family protein [Steroidobacteraceae bacterium]|nr:FecR family protein [Steroidobacteraceae bacterium]